MPEFFRVFPGEIESKQEKYGVKSLIISIKMTNGSAESLFLYDQTI